MLSGNIVFLGFLLHHVTYLSCSRPGDDDVPIFGEKKKKKKKPIKVEKKSKEDYLVIGVSSTPRQF